MKRDFSDKEWVDGFFSGKKIGFEEGRIRGWKEARLFVERFFEKFNSLNDEEFKSWLER